MNNMFRTTSGNIYQLGAIIGLRRVVGANDKVSHWLDRHGAESIFIMPSDFHELQDVLSNPVIGLEYTKQERDWSNAVQKVYMEGYEDGKNAGVPAHGMTITD